MPFRLRGLAARRCWRSCCDQRLRLHSRTSARGREPRAASDFAASRSLAGQRCAMAGRPVGGRAMAIAQLHELIDEALAGSPDLEAAAARMRTADGFAQRAGAALKPQVDGIRSGRRSASSARTAPCPAAAIPNGWNDGGAVGLSFSLDLDLWGKNRAAFRAAKLDADAARYEFEEAQLGLSTGIAATYAELVSLYAQRDSAPVRTRHPDADGASSSSSASRSGSITSRP